MRLWFVLSFCLLHVHSITQLTFTGDNVNPVLSDDNRYVLFEASGGEYGHKCSQIYLIDLEHLSQDPYRISSGYGTARNPSFTEVHGKMGAVYSTDLHYHLPIGSKTVDDTCRQHLCDRKRNDITLRRLCSNRTLEELMPTSDIYRVNWVGNVEKVLTGGFYSNTEPTVRKKRILYTSMKSGDPDLWVSDTDGQNKKQLTNDIGYEGEASVSPTGRTVVYTATVPDNHRRYQKLLRYNLVDKTNTQLFVMNSDGTGKRQLTNLRGYNGRARFLNEATVIFRSNDYKTYLIQTDGTNLRPFMHYGKHGYPTVSRDNKKYLWSSKDNGTGNIYLSDIDVATRLQFKSYTKKESTVIQHEEESTVTEKVEELHYPEEKHLNSVAQLTFGGQNAEGYFNFASKNILFQAMGKERYGTLCDQIYKLNIEKLVDENTHLQRISTGLGACTCSYFFPDDQTYIYASTFAAVKPDHLENTCPPKKCQSSEATTDPILKKLCNTSYTWDIVPDYDIYKVNKYGNIIKRLTSTPGYDAEGAVSPNGKNIVFMSMRTGDPELWLMDSEGENLRQLTNVVGYDGGPFFSPDGTKVIFRASRPKTEQELEKYRKLLSYNLVEPLEMELFEINIDGTGMRQITYLGGSNWAPFFLLDNDRILYSTNFNVTGFGAFDIYMVNRKADKLERITYNKNGFDSFPMQSRDGKKVIWGSSRNGKTPYDLNLFLADWTD
ncbi:unnamed protein product [Bursaphelenchus okinawaensis]|uniref:Uncharacterized protein n=1 Tax=Bursaphelenchus okinawaensis TaxID=465554 RepID=A0A811JTM7_9BILA|nr:unnamed protein product [Bursaphelenchus okinawaensis]CAG9083260.1 unnamed protein product [Bursaphelenchus okinawaensis]